MKPATLLLAMGILAGCGQPPAAEDLILLNGYWEISSVESGDGKNHSYGPSTTIDYLHIDGMQGYRKKVQPQIGGPFLTSDDATFFRIREEDGRFVISYAGTEDSWEETLLHIDSLSFSVRNAQNVRYYYQRYEPIDLSP